MDWLDRINNAMDYIETNLAGEISYDKIAQLALLFRVSLSTDVSIHHRRDIIGIYPTQAIDAGCL